MTEQKTPHGDARAPHKDPGPEPTHDLLLSDGTVLPHHGAIPTHVAVEDRELRVLHAAERKSR